MDTRGPSASAVVSLRYACSPGGRHHTGSAHRTPSLLSSARWILFVAVTGIRSTTRTNRGAIFVPRSGWASRNAAKARGWKSPAIAAITWSPVTGSGTAYTATASAPSYRARMFSIIAAARFSLSTRSRSSVRPAK
ncbi:hypothetical protein AQJ84_33375 [Streptomyces resistomycificus]|uniref:Uncharacterized protein n=1 Tax=Streptomyces resistomycificus TaxID=67356 RepID=A0A0L8LD56_9ACTN|nr:hypothetical protein ADK37_14050 [Streptomyces resistomycificus]KUN92377.1 hypothetical protein AQJ84_33375 [Streptomyces resistomycificus]